uniref:Uncharacterized protein n=1 Tax=Salmo trutta TaxID=8032 RepID=A0A673Z142_SALTR
MCTDYSLPIHSHICAHTLCDGVDKGERLLSLAEMCHKLKTEHKKPPSEELAQGWVWFWKRYNKVLLDRLCLGRERSSDLCDPAAADLIATSSLLATRSSTIASPC